MAGRGRPPKYTADFIEAEIDALLQWIEADENFWLKDFAIQRGYPAECFSIWAKNNENFSQALKRAKDIQETRLVKGALKGDLVPSMAIFALKNVAGYRDNKDINVGTGTPTSWADLIKAAMGNGNGNGNKKTVK